MIPDGDGSSCDDDKFGTLVKFQPKKESKYNPELTLITISNYYKSHIFLRPLISIEGDK